MTLSKDIIRIGLICVAFFSISACRGRVADTVHEMLSKKVVVDTADMTSLVPKRDLYGTIENPRYTLIIYFNDASCTTCEATKLNDWHKLLRDIYDKYHSVSACFIFAPRDDSKEQLEDILQEQQFGHVVYVDNKNNFEKNNIWLPKQALYHTFLIDADGRIVLVGNPLHNQSIYQLFVEIVKQ